MRDSIRAWCTEPVGDSPAQMAEKIKDDTAKYAKLVKEAKVAIE